MDIKSRKSLLVTVALVMLVTVLSLVILVLYAQIGAYPLYPAIEEVNITKVDFDVPNRRIMITANNSGTSYVIINEIWVNNNKETNVTPPLPSNITANDETVFNVTLSSINNGYSYQVKLITIKGNEFIWTATAPN